MRGCRLRVEGHMSIEGPRPPFIARTIRRLSVLIILAWAALTLVVTFAVPPLERVGEQHAVPLAPLDAPSVRAMTSMGKAFKESDSDSFAMVVLEGRQRSRLGRSHIRRGGCLK